MKLTNRSINFELKKGIKNPFKGSCKGYEINIEISTVSFSKGNDLIIIPLENFDYLKVFVKDEEGN